MSDSERLVAALAGRYAIERELGQGGSAPPGVSPAFEELKVKVPGR